MTDIVKETTRTMNVRWQAFKSLWLHRSYWRLNEPNKLLRETRDTQLTEYMPLFILVAALLGMGIFILIPSVLPEQAASLTSVIWPVWVATAAPMVCAQVLALLVAPELALDLVHKHESGYFATLNTAYGAPAGTPCVPWIVSLSAVCVVASFLVILFSVVIGLGLALMFSVGDVRATFDAVLQSAPPIKWIRAGASAMILGAIVGISAVLFAWPGTQTSNSNLDSHRLGLRVMLVCSISAALGGSLINWVASLFDRAI
jgi:hypothetical protein